MLTVYNWARPRDLSHYETFSHYHRTLYRQVEALSVTPFAPRALDRGLTGVLVSLLRLCGLGWNPNPGAGLVDPADRWSPARARRSGRAPTIRSVPHAAERARGADLRAARGVEGGGGRSGSARSSTARGKSDTDVSLLQEPGIEGWSGWTVPTSMRNVETAVPLELREHGISAPREDWVPPERSAPILPKDGDVKSQRRSVGELRPSQLMHTYGVGATVELPGADHARARARRLAARARRARLGAAPARGRPCRGRIAGRAAAHAHRSCPRATAPAFRSRRSRAGCAARSAAGCRPIDHGVFTLKVDPWRPERTKYVHEGCPKTKSTRPPTAFPARYMMACQNGHLDDFPWVEFLHGSLPCKGTLKLIELGSSGRAGDVQLQCDECGRRRRLSQAFGEDAAAFLPPRCRGRHPHLGISEHCERCRRRCCSARATLGSRSRAPRLSIPSQASELAQRIDEAWAILGIYPPGLEILDANLKSPPRPEGPASARREARTSKPSRTRSRLAARGSRTARPRTCSPRNGESCARPTMPPISRTSSFGRSGRPHQFAGLLADVVLVERLREVSALRGFTRINAPDELSSQGGTIVRLSREATEVAAVQRGPRRRHLHPLPRAGRARVGGPLPRVGRRGVLRDGNRAWRERRGLDGDAGWPGERYVLLHSFAHALIRELALECGYTASSIRERLYATSG